MVSVENKRKLSNKSKTLTAFTSEDLEFLKDVQRLESRMQIQVNES